MNKKAKLKALYVKRFTTDLSKKVTGGRHTWSDCPMISFMSCHPDTCPTVIEFE